MTKNDIQQSLNEPPTTHTAERNSEPDRSVIISSPWKRFPQLLVHVLAQGLRSVHYGIGITTLSTEATPAEELRFVLFWVALLLFLVLFFAILLYLLR